MGYGRRVRSTVGWVAGVAMALGAILANLGVVPPLGGFALFALGGIVALITGLASLIALARGRGLTAGGGFAAVAGIVFLALATRSSGHPRINDFTTDLVDPPRFERAATLPPNAGRDLGYPADYAAIQRDCCSDLRPARVALPPRDAYERALAVAQAMPTWQVTHADGATGIVEATATSRVFRFVDDVVIRVRPEGTGSKVDLRSKSRDGRGDVGANAARIRAYVTALESLR
jgi:uncharacterized protein (DUF1499 family)